jgi:hypothetical protein
MDIPPFNVIGITGALGNIQRQFLISPNALWFGISDHPRPVSPNPCKKMIDLSQLFVPPPLSTIVSTTNGGGELYSVNDCDEDELAMETNR